MAVNKVVFGNTTVMDITDSTVTASKLKSGETAYAANGAKITGELVVPDVLDDLSDVTINTPANAHEIYYNGSQWINYGAKILLTFDDAFQGQTITLSKDQTVITKVAPSTGNSMSLYVSETGEWTISSTIDEETYETVVTITTFGLTYAAELESTPPTPEGATVEPTDDIQTWLKCANLDKPYTTLAEVLADRETFETLIADSNACDYMARSTSWALAEGSVPQMTSDTTPKGEAYCNSAYGTLKAFNVFDRDIATGWHGAQNIANAYIAYIYEKKQIIRAFSLRLQGTFGGTKNIAIFGANTEDPDVTVLYTNQINFVANVNYELVDTFSNDTAFDYYGIRFTEVMYNGSTYMALHELQFYDADITRNQDAMSLIGKYDYCSNSLLNNETWCEAIVSSDYWDKVLENIIPIMTDNTHPSGTAMCSTYSTASSITWGAWRAFDKGNGADPTVGWRPSTNGAINEYVAYQFDEMPSNVSRYKIVCRHTVSGGVVAGYLQGYDGSEWRNLTEYLTLTNDPEGLVSNTYQAYRVYVTARSTSSGYYYIPIFALYGRKSKEVLVPLVPTMTSNTTPSGECIANGYISGYPEYYGFDKVIDSGNNAHCWAVAGTSGWLGYHFPRPVKVDQIVLTQRTESGAGQNQNVKTATVQYSDDGIVWVDDANGIQTYSQAVANTVNVAENNAHAYWRINVASIYNDTAGAVAILELQFYQRTVQTNIVHSCANDTIYYMEDGSPVIVATTNSDGDGVLDFSSLEDKEYTFYSSVAKDPSNLSNDFSKTIRITKSEFGGTTEMYLMPDTVKTLYWYGYEDNELQDITSANGWTLNNTPVAPTHNTNNISIPGNGGVGTKNLKTVTNAYIIASRTGSDGGSTFAFDTDKDLRSGVHDNVAVPSSLSKTQITNTGSDSYIATWTGSNRTITLYAFWYE